MPSRSCSNTGLGLLSVLIKYPQYSLAAIEAVLSMIVVVDDRHSRQDFPLLSGGYQASDFQKRRSDVDAEAMDLTFVHDSEKEEKKQWK